jgi:hypothetical protein
MCETRRLETKLFNPIHVREVREHVPINSDADAEFVISTVARTEAFKRELGFRLKGVFRNAAKKWYLVMTRSYMQDHLWPGPKTM